MELLDLKIVPCLSFYDSLYVFYLLRLDFLEFLKSFLFRFLFGGLDPLIIGFIVRMLFLLIFITFKVLWFFFIVIFVFIVRLVFLFYFFLHLLLVFVILLLSFFSLFFLVFFFKFTFL